MTQGWGSIPWGGGAWGASGAPLRLLKAEAVRENVVRLYFDQPVLFTGIFDPGDAADPSRYSIVPVDGTVGLDGFPARPVSPAAIELAADAGSGGSEVDVTLDRPLSPYPSGYVASVNQLRSAQGTLLDLTAVSASFLGVARGVRVPTTDRTYANGDLANPQTVGTLPDAAGLAVDPSLLGSYVPDDTGDYAADSGLASYKKRIFRRCSTRKGAFAHLPNYGVGVPGLVKQLGKVGVRETVAAEAEAQIRLEPETQSVTATFVQSSQAPGLWILRIRAKMITGDVVSRDLPFSAS